MEQVTNSPEETWELGRELGSRAVPGQVYCLNEISAVWERPCSPRALPADWGSKDR